LVSIRHLTDLKFIKDQGDRIVICPLTSISELEHSEIIKKNAHCLFQAANHFADPTTRHSATIGGNIANASPAADTATPLLALNAIIRVKSADGDRTIPASEFFVGVNKTALLPEEMITAIEIVKNEANSGSCFIKLGLRNAMAISVISVAAGAQLENGSIKEVSIAFGSVAPTPVRALKTESYLSGKALTEDVLNEAKKLVQTDISPIDDVRASAEYRRDVAGVLLARALKEVNQ
jgi:carbon-monoxide dehydrogenase medium subunit